MRIRFVLALVLLTIGNSLFAQTSTPVNTSIRLSACVTTPSTHRLVGWGRYGLHFMVPKKTVELKGGKPDIDYVTYIVKPIKDDSSLELWFGPISLSPGPDRESAKKLTSFTRTEIIDDRGEVVGVDYSGSRDDGRRWRKFVVGSEGSLYRDVPAASADLFDSIINSACEVPYSK